MILCDTGITVALSSPTDQYHATIIEVMRDVKAKVITTWACITEAMYLVRSLHNQRTVSSLVESGFLELVELSSDDFSRASTLMWKYSDSPMDFADATLVVAAEKLGATQILTLDRHFYAYRISDKTPFEIFP